jgi:hypothetical protein
VLDVLPFTVAGHNSISRMGEDSGLQYSPALSGAGHANKAAEKRGEEKAAKKLKGQDQLRG